MTVPDLSAVPAVDLEAAADQAIAACAGDARAAVKSLIVAVDLLTAQTDELRAAVSTGYARGRHAPARERKDETDV